MVDAAQQEIARELAAGESLLWYGVPRQGIRLRSNDALLIPFSLLWGGFAFFWEATAFASHAPAFFLLWGVPFVLAGVYLIIGRFYVDSIQRARTAYGLTSTRAIIVNGLRGRTVKSLPLKTLSDFTLTELSDRSGTIALGTPSPYGRVLGATSSWPGAPSTPAFDMIEDAKSVYSMIRNAQTA